MQIYRRDILITIIEQIPKIAQNYPTIFSISSKGIPFWAN